VRHGTAVILQQETPRQSSTMEKSENATHDERGKWIEHAIKSDMTKEQQAKFLQLQYVELYAERVVSLPSGSMLQAVYLLLAERTILLDRDIKRAMPNNREAEVTAALEALRAKDWLEKRTVQGLVAWYLEAPADYAAMTMQDAERLARER
jgi:hypothetical protein